MTETEWLAGVKPNPMLDDLEWQGRVSSRKQQFLVCSCVKHIWHLLREERLRAGGVARDMYVDGLVNSHELRAAEAAAQKAKAEIPLPPGFGSGIYGIVPVAAPVWAAFAAVATVEGSGNFQSVSILVLQAVLCESSSKLQEPVSAEWS